MTHPSLENYGVDGDYCGVDNRSPDSSLARDSMTDRSPDNERSRVCQSCDTASEQSSDTMADTTAGQYPDTLHTPAVNYSHTIYEGQANESTRDRNMVLNDISPTSNDGRSVTRTYWRSQDVPAEKQEQYDRLIGYQEGQWAQERKTQNRKADNRRAIDAFGTTLDCTEHQRDVAESIIEQTNLNHMGIYSYRHSVLGALSIATFITDQRDVKNTPPYRQLVNEIDSNPSEMRNVRQLLRKKSDYFDT